MYLAPLFCVSRSLCGLVLKLIVSVSIPASSPEVSEFADIILCGDIDADGLGDLAICYSLAALQSASEESGFLSEVAEVMVISAKSGKPVSVFSSGGNYCCGCRPSVTFMGYADDQESSLLAVGQCRGIAVLDLETGGELMSIRFPDGAHFGGLMVRSPDLDGDGHDDLLASIVRKSAGVTSQAVVAYSLTSGSALAVFVGSSHSNWALGAVAAEVKVEGEVAAPFAVLRGHGDGGSAQIVTAARVWRSQKGVVRSKWVYDVWSSRDWSLLYSYSREVGSPVGDPWRIGTVEDISGDGLPELVVSYRGFAIDALASEGGVAWSYRPVSYPFGLGATLEVADITGDAKPEVLLGSNEDNPRAHALGQGRGRVVVLRHSNGSVMLDRVEGPLGDNLEQASKTGLVCCAIGDVDGDGVRDIACMFPRLAKLEVMSGSDLSTIYGRSIMDLRREINPGAGR